MLPACCYSHTTSYEQNQLTCHFPHFSVKKKKIGNIYKVLASVFPWLSSHVKVLFVFPSLSPLHSPLISTHFHLPSHPNRRGLWGIDFSPVLPGETVGSAIAHGARGCWLMGKRRAAALTKSFSVGCSAYHTKHTEQGSRHPDGINTLTEKKQRRTSGITETCDSKKQKTANTLGKQVFSKAMNKIAPWQKNNTLLFWAFCTAIYGSKKIVHLVLEGKGQNKWDRLRDSRHCHFVLAVMTCYLRWSLWGHLSQKAHDCVRSTVDDCQFNATS